ncbi:hypothetical protein HYH03_002553 [Edaphochlamys debaryana]|uniref:Guanylate cyclase domain-containing protein n=1 Tax=Edaphochlamys debaryana TaxID=47281 RepID=A0A836C597_9CHLO|nr:hypothetical protein HYH03_002553 [Edaphochlamys debaryana]|eukprot:KAG2499614.1 hypothetical protein HYH03_002553 [Edaphochlamys debaryana]
MVRPGSGLAVLDRAALESELRAFPQPVAVLYVSYVDTVDPGAGAHDSLMHSSMASLAGRGMDSTLALRRHSGDGGTRLVFSTEAGSTAVGCVLANTAAVEALQLREEQDVLSFLARSFAKDPSLKVLFQDIVKRLLQGQLTTVNHFVPGDFGRDRYFLSMRISPFAWRMGAGEGAGGRHGGTLRGLSPESGHLWTGDGLATAASASLAGAPGAGPGGEGGPGGVAPAMILELDVPYEGKELAARLQRDYMCLSHIPSIVAMFDVNGRVLHQNSTSFAYWGNAMGAQPFHGPGGTGPGGAALAFLRSLLAADPSQAEAAIRAVAEGREWKGLALMPASLADSLAPCCASQPSVSQVAARFSRFGRASSPPAFLSSPPGQRPAPAVQQTLVKAPAVQSNLPHATHPGAVAPGGEQNAHDSPPHSGQPEANGTAPRRGDGATSEPAAVRVSTGRTEQAGPAGVATGVNRVSLDTAEAQPPTRLAASAAWSRPPSLQSSRERPSVPETSTGASGGRQPSGRSTGRVLGGLPVPLALDVGLGTGPDSPFATPAQMAPGSPATRSRVYPWMPSPSGALEPSRGAGSGRVASTARSLSHLPLQGSSADREPPVEKALSKRNISNTSVGTGRGSGASRLDSTDGSNANALHGRDGGGGGGGARPLVVMAAAAIERWSSRTGDTGGAGVLLCKQWRWTVEDVTTTGEVPPSHDTAFSIEFLNGARSAARGRHPSLPTTTTTSGEHAPPYQPPACYLTPPERRTSIRRRALQSELAPGELDSLTPSATSVRSAAISTAQALGQQAQSHLLAKVGLSLAGARTGSSSSRGAAGANASMGRSGPLPPPEPDVLLRSHSWSGGNSSGHDAAAAVAAAAAAAVAALGSGEPAAAGGLAAVPAEPPEVEAAGAARSPVGAVHDSARSPGGAEAASTTATAGAYTDTSTAGSGTGAAAGAGAASNGSVGQPLLLPPSGGSKASVDGCELSLALPMLSPGLHMASLDRSVRGQVQKPQPSAEQAAGGLQGQRHLPDPTGSAPMVATEAASLGGSSQDGYSGPADRDSRGGAGTDSPSLAFLIFQGASSSKDASTGGFFLSSAAVRPRPRGAMPRTRSLEAARETSGSRSSHGAPSLPPIAEGRHATTLALALASLEASFTQSGPVTGRNPRQQAAESSGDDPLPRPVTTPQPQFATTSTGPFAVTAFGALPTAPAAGAPASSTGLQRRARGLLRLLITTLGSTAAGRRTLASTGAANRLLDTEALLLTTQGNTAAMGLTETVVQLPFSAAMVHGFAEPMSPHETSEETASDERAGLRGSAYNRLLRFAARPGGGAPSVPCHGVSGRGRAATCGQQSEGASLGRRWHEVLVRPCPDPLSSEPAVLVVQTDVTKAVQAEAALVAALEAEHALLSDMLPSHVLTRLTHDRRAEAAQKGANPLAELTAIRRDPAALATYHESITVLFADIKGFTEMSKEVAPAVVMTFLNDLYTRFDSLTDVYGVYKVETIGDCYMVAGGLMARDEDGYGRAVRGEGNSDPLHAMRVVAFARAMLEEAAKVALPNTGEPVKLRVGMHSGPATSGVVGQKMPRFCLFGDTVNTASRMSTGHPGLIHVSAATRRLLPPEEDAEGWAATGGVEVKGKGRMDTFVWRHVESSGPRGQPRAAGAAAGACCAPCSWAPSPAP